MPEGWVIDADGKPITDPRLVDDGFLVPIGGYKGSGLNIMIGILAGVMTGAAFGRQVVNFRSDAHDPTNTGQSIFVFRPDLFMPNGGVQARNGPPAPGVPGLPIDDRRTRPAARGAPTDLEIEQRRSGIPVPTS